MCHASVTCLDCNTTFAGPAQFKAHTTCISEAEKYQKGLYKGPKGNASAGTYQSWGGGGGSGGWGRGAPRVQATGANVTPLGTPLRMSPVTTPAPVPIEAPLPKTNGTHAGANGGASDGAKDAAVSVTPAKGKEDKKDKKKDKKRKAGAVDGGGSAQVSIRVSL
ncbi:hypothetical protein IEO21_04510 [Rhodonia placenta]|uniref:Zinc finger C2H2 LYAR-type domain-containing protein n=1 Tax=Rhodonia placenta TaxID=104341 RepID=A0A8H7P417_9APHY|nr:hypothetical protein IEO21_04510 [Postia placenta]